MPLRVHLRQRQPVRLPECSHEWTTQAASEATETRVWKDAFGNELKNGDSVTVIKDLKVRGASSTLKAGTKVKNIRLVEGDHDIDCKIEGLVRCSSSPSSSRRLELAGPDWACSRRECPGGRAGFRAPGCAIRLTAGSPVAILMFDDGFIFGETHVLVAIFGSDDGGRSLWGSRVLAEDETSTNIVIENSPELAKARDDYQKMMTAARDRLLKAFADEEDQLTSSSKFKPEEKLKRLDQLEKERQAFEESGAIPKTVGLKKAVDTYKKQTQQARDNCSKVFDTQANKILKQDRDAAADILAAKKELLDPTPQAPGAPETPPSTPALPDYKELVFSGHTGKVSAVRIVPRTVLLITGGNSFHKVNNGPGKGNTHHPGDDNTIRLWNLATGHSWLSSRTDWAAQQTVMAGPGRQSHSGPTAFAVATCRPSADYCNPTISVWATETGKLLAQLPLTGRSGVWAPWFSVEGLNLHAFRADTTWHHLTCGHCRNCPKRSFPNRRVKRTCCASVCRVIASGSAAE